MSPSFNYGPGGYRPTRKNWVPSIRTMQLSDNVLCFHDGRTRTGEPVFARTDENWVQIDMDLGTAAYAIFEGDAGLIVDTMLTTEQAAYMRMRLEGLGVKKFTVINTHIDPDHIGGNATFSDSQIISLQGSYDVLCRLKEEGQFWGEPIIDPFVLPNTHIAKDETLEFGSYKLKLLKVEAHQEGGSLCVYIPEYKAVIVGDVVEDTVSFIIHPQDILTGINETKRLLDFDITHVLPMHGDPEKMLRVMYGREFIHASINYQQALYDRVREPDYLESEVTDFIGQELKNGTLTLFEPYKDLHKQNCRLMHDYWVNGIKPVY